MSDSDNGGFPVLPPHLQVVWDFLHEHNVSPEDMFRVWLAMGKGVPAKVEKSKAIKLFMSFTTEQLGTRLLTREQFDLLLEATLELAALIGRESAREARAWLGKPILLGAEPTLPWPIPDKEVK